MPLGHLFESFRNKGIHGRNEMPEDEPPPDVQSGSLDLALFMTLTVAIDYQRDADALCKGLERSLPTPRPDTCSIQPRYIGGTEEGSRGLVEIRRSKKPRKDCDI